MSEAYHKVHISGINAHHHLGGRGINRGGIVIIVILWLRVVWPVISTGLAVNIIVSTRIVMMVMMAVVMVTMMVAMMTMPPARLR